MLKFLAKTAEKYAKATNTACAILYFWHTMMNGNFLYDSFCMAIVYMHLDLTMLFDLLSAALKYRT